MKKLSFAIIFFLLFSYQTGVCAEQYDSQDAFSISSGSLSFSVDPIAPRNVDNAQWTITLENDINFQKKDHVTVSDLSGTNQGWKFTVDFTNFTNITPIEDPTVADAELYVYVDVEDWLSLKMVDDSEGLSELKPEGATLNPASSKGTAISSENYVANNSIIDSGLMELLKIEPGFGAGVFDFYLMYDINVSAWLPDGTTIKSTGQSGSFPNANPVIVANDVQKYQIFAGTYQTTITYNISGNPMI